MLKRLLLALVAVLELPCAAHAQAPLLTAYVGLCTAYSAGVATEFSGTGYVRQPVALNYDAGGQALTFQAPVFPAMTWASSPPTCVAVYDAATSGNLLFEYSIPNPAYASGSQIVTPGGRVLLKARLSAVTPIQPYSLIGDEFISANGQTSKEPVYAGSATLVFSEASGSLTVVPAPMSTTGAGAQPGAFAAIAKSQGILSSLRSISGRQVWVPICGRLGANGTATADLTSTYSMDQTGCYAPSWGTVSAVKLVYGGFDIPANGEQDRAITATVDASVFAPGNRNFTTTLGASYSSGATTVAITVGNVNYSNAVSVGQRITFSGAAAATYVTGVATTVNSANIVTGITVTLSTATTGSATNGETVTLIGQIAPATFNGGHTLTISPIHGLYYSDPLPITLSPNQVFFTRTYASLSAAGIQLMETPNGSAQAITSGIYGEFDTRGTTGINDTTLSPFTGTDSGIGHFGPIEVLALVTPTSGITTPGAVLVMGDSIGAGAGDDSDGLGNVGYVARSLNNSVPYINVSRGSTTLLQAIGQSEGQHSLSIDQGITDVLHLLGRNDLEAYGVSAATLETQLATFNARYANEGKRVWCGTYPPYTASNDGWATLANQGWIQESDVTSGSTSAGSSTITLTAPPTTNIVGTRVSLAAQDGIYTGSAGAAAGTNTVTMVSAVSPTSGYIWGPFVPNGTQYTASGNVLTLSNGATFTSALAPYQEINLDNGIFGGTTVVSVSGAVVTLSHVTTGVVIPTTSGINFYSQTANSIETQRQLINTYIRSSAGQAALSCPARLIDNEAVWVDPGGSHKWRVDLGGSTYEGIHPSPQISIYSYGQGVIPVSSFTNN